MARTVRYLSLAACALAALSFGGCVASTGTPDIAQARVAAETGFSIGAVGLEATLQTGVVLPADAPRLAQRLQAAHAALLAGRLAFTAAGQPVSPALQAAQAQADADFNRVEAELRGR